MLRLLHMADVHLGERRPDLGDAAPTQRDRQLAAFAAAIDIALAEKADLVLVAGDLFASNVQPRRTVERVAKELARLTGARIRVVILPGDHDPDGLASVYRAYDLPALAGVREGDDLITVLSADRPWVHLQALDVVVLGAVPGAGPAGTLDALAAELAAAPAAAWRIGLAHAAPGADGAADLTDARIAGSGLDYLALGHAHQRATGVAGATTWGVPGSPEQVDVTDGEPGGVLLVAMDIAGDARRVVVVPRTTGRTVRRSLDVDAAAIESQAALVTTLRRGASPDEVLDVRLTGTRPDALLVDPAEVEEALRGDYLRVRVTDASVPPLTTGELPPADTVAGAFLRNVEGRIAELEAADDEEADDEAAELREVLRLGRRLLAGEVVLA